MRQFFRVIFWGLLVAGAGFALVRLSRPPEIAVTEELYRFNRARAEAVKAHNQVAYSRHTVDNAGRLLAGARRDGWRIIEETAPAVAGGPALQVVFVHDQDVTLAESINRGNYLSQLVRQWTRRQKPGLPVEFHTFSWRADFGPEEFASARLAAHVQSASLASYLQAIGRPNAPLVILAHGLGAQLVLDALHARRLNRVMPRVRAVLLVQPAVPRIDLARGTYEVTAGDEVKAVRYEGPHFLDLGAAHSVLATCSRTDGVLSQEFPGETGEAPRAPKRGAALGLPYASPTEAELFPENFRLVDLSPGKHLDMALPGHDSLYDASGRRALWAMWQSVLRQL
ncbi:MAG: hypothetical protein HY302_10265 [Opitutae bacterium]|nr:hypothetical protein [Opitutae bacterium]